MKLQGMNVVCFESRHAETMAGLVRVQGGVPMLAPSMKEVPLENNTHVFSFAEKLFSGQIEVLILLTGVGVKSLVDVLETRWPRESVLDALRKTTIVPRGPKPVRVLNEWKVPFALTVPEPNTWREIISTLDANTEKVPLKGRVVAVQEYGVTNEEFISALQARGAEVLRVPVYRWALPDDLGPLENAVRETATGRMDVAIFTTAVQIEHLLQVAQRLGLDKKVLEAFKAMAIASVGPDCSEALRARGIGVDIEPESPKMGPLVVACAAEAEGIIKAKRMKEGDCSVEVLQGTLAVMADEDLRQSPFLKACRREKTDFTPVWLMRQAGRYMKDYRDVREKMTFLELCKNPALCAEVTVHAQKKIGADAAIIFSDILLPFEPMGLGLDYVKGDGPSVARPVREKKDVDGLRDADPVRTLSYVYDAIKITRASLDADIPLIGFAGAPFTLASYMIEGGASKDFILAKNFMAADEGLWKALMDKIVKAGIQHLNAQADAGCQALQIFDSWAGILTPEEYRRYALPYSRALIRGLKKGVPVIHFGTRTGNFLELMREAGGDVIGADHRIGLDAAWRKIGYDRAIQGNLDPEILCGPLDAIRPHVERILLEAEGRPGHIFNLGHGVLPRTPEENVIALIDIIHELSRR